MTRSDGTVRFFIGERDEKAVAARLRVSSGVVRAAQCSCADMYEATAFVSALPWRPLDTHDYAALTTGEPPIEPGSWVTVVRLPDDVRVAIDRAGLAQADTPEGVVAAADSAEGCAALEKVEGYARRHLVQVDGFTMLALGVHAASLPTTTYDPATGRHIGLHLDAWDGPPLGGPDQARRARLVANLGCSDRYFLYAPVARRALIIALDGPDGPWNGRPIHLETAYLERYPSQPIVQVRVAPGEAYIAPTDDLIHDGSTVGQVQQDITVTYLGHFAPIPATLDHEAL